MSDQLLTLRELGGVAAAVALAGGRYCIAGTSAPTTTLSKSARRLSTRPWPVRTRAERMRSQRSLSSRVRATGVSELHILMSDGVDTLRLVILRTLLVCHVYSHSIQSTVTFACNILHDGTHIPCLQCPSRLQPKITYR